MKSIAVTSGKGGTGKSCVTAYTGAALAGRGQRTLLLELGHTFRSLDLITGVQDQAVFDIADVLAGRCDAEKAIIPCGIQGNLFLLPAGLNPVPGLSGTELQFLLASFAAQYDFVLIDGIDLAAVAPATVDTVVQVLTPDSLSVRACAHQARQLYEEGAKHLRLVINNVPAQILPMYGAQDFDDIIDMVGTQLLGVIPASPSLQYSSNNAQALDEESMTVKVFDSIAGRLLGKRLPLLIR